MASFGGQVDAASDISLEGSLSFTTEELADIASLRERLADFSLDEGTSLAKTYLSEARRVLTQ